ncbi:hypothetical protein D3C86_1351470 [compost metagenome]
MKGVDQYAAVFTPGVFHDTRGLLKIARIGPGHELQMRVQPIGCRQITELGKMFRQPLFIRVVAGHQQFTGTQLGTHRQDFLEVGNNGLRFEPQDFDVQHPNTGIAQTRQGLAPQFVVGHQGKMVLLRGRRYQTQADMAVTGPRGDLDHVGR